LSPGEKDIPSLVRRLRGADDSNFGLFNYVNEVNAEVDTLEEQIAAIMAEVDRYRRQASAEGAAQRAALFVRLTLSLCWCPLHHHFFG
jgi:coiled-coil domain-containing protein 63/114